MGGHTTAAVGDLVSGCGVPARVTGPSAWRLELPLTRRGPIGLDVTAGDRTLALRGFVMRGPDRAREEVYARLLRRHAEVPVCRFGIDAHGDVWVFADAPLAALDEDAFDALLGLVASAVDEVYEGIVRTGFDVPPDAVFAPPPGA